MVRGLRSAHSLIPIVAVCGVMLLGATACGGSSSAASPPSTRAGGSGQTPFNPGVSGTIASVTTGSLEVQDPQNGQTTVTYTADTPVLSEASGTLADVVVGSCVIVTSSSTAKSGVPVTAATVAVSAATANGCTGQGGFGGQRGQRSANGQRPANGEGSTGTAHKSAADSKASTSHKFVRPTIGEVTAINGQGFTVKAVQRKSSAATASSSKSTAPSSRAASPTTSNVLVTTTGSTTYTDTVSADASALVVGKCLIATGTADDTGTVAANLLRVSSAGASGCSTASGRGRFGSPGAGGNG